MAARWRRRCCKSSPAATAAAACDSYRNDYQLFSRPSRCCQHTHLVGARPAGPQKRRLAGARARGRVKHASAHAAAHPMVVCERSVARVGISLRFGKRRAVRCGWFSMRNKRDIPPTLGPLRTPMLTTAVANIQVGIRLAVCVAPREGGGIARWDGRPALPREAAGGSSARGWRRRSRRPRAAKPHLPRKVHAYLGCHSCVGRPSGHARRNGAREQATL